MPDNARILIVDDDPAIHRVAKVALKKITDEIMCVERGHQVDSSVTSYMPDLILLDLDLPDAHGTDICHSLREKGVDIPIVFLTGTEDTKSRIESLRAGGNDYLIKPFHPAELQARLSNLLKTKQLTDLLKQEKKEANKLAMIAKYTDNAVIITNRHGLIEWVNEGFTHLTGYTKSEVLARKPGDFLQGKDTCAETVNYIREHLSQGESFSTEILNYHKNGTPYWVSLDIKAIKNEEGKLTKFFAMQKDITERKNALSAMKESQERFELAVKGSRDGIWDWQINSGKIYLSPKWRQMVRHENLDEYVQFEAWLDLVEESHRDRLKNAVNSCLAGLQEEVEEEIEMIDQKGRKSWMLCRAATFKDDTGKVVRLAGSLADINQLKSSQEELRLLAEQDKLTGLINRRVMSGLIDLTVQKCVTEPNHKFAVLFFDFDRFKSINDSLGHDVGDALLISIADRFRKVLNENEIAARFGGDEFVILLDEIESYDVVPERCQLLLDTFAQSHQLGEHEVISTASIGVVSSEVCTESSDEVLRDADIAMYQAKTRGKAQYVIFDQSMHDEIKNRLELERELRNADFDRDMEMLYQPIISLIDRAIIGFETFLRWHHPERGDIPPAQFIEIAEESGQIVELGNWVAQNVLSTARHWEREMNIPSALLMTLNLTKRQILSPKLFDSLEKIIRDVDARPENICFDIKESVMMDERIDIRSIMLKMRDTGFKISMDDFGTGQSPLRCLEEFPIDYLKIDRSIIQPLQEKVQLSSVVQSMVTLAHYWDIEVIAEGVEELSQLAQLQTMDCDAAQGYLFAAPLTAQEAFAFLKNGTAWEMSA